MIRRNGFTLIEAIVAIAVIAVAGAVATLGMSAVLRPRSSDTVEQVIQEARRRAIQDGRPARAMVDDSSFATGLFLPDGRVIAPGFDLLTGKRLVR